MSFSRTDAAEGFSTAVSAVGSVFSSVKNFVSPSEDEPKFRSNRSMPGFGSDGTTHGSNQGFQSYHNSSATGFSSSSQPWAPAKKKSRKDSWDWGEAASKKSKKKKKKGKKGKRKKDEYEDFWSSDDEEQSSDVKKKKPKKKKSKRKQESDSDSDLDSEPEPVKKKKSSKKKSKKRIESDPDSEPESEPEPKPKRKKNKKRKPEKKSKSKRRKKKVESDPETEPETDSEPEESSSDPFDAPVVTPTSKRKPKKASKKKSSSKSPKVLSKKLQHDDDSSDLEDLFGDAEPKKKKKNKKKVKKTAIPEVKQQEVPDLLDLEALKKEKAGPESLLDDFGFGSSPPPKTTDDIFSIPKSNDNLLTSSMMGVPQIVQPNILGGPTAFGGPSNNASSNVFTQLSGPSQTTQPGYPRGQAGVAMRPGFQQHGYAQAFPGQQQPQAFAQQSAYFPQQTTPQRQMPVQSNKVFPALSTPQQKGKKKVNKTLGFNDLMSAENFSLGKQNVPTGTSLGYGNSFM